MKRTFALITALCLVISCLSGCGTTDAAAHAQIEDQQIEQEVVTQTLELAVVPEETVEPVSAPAAEDVAVSTIPLTDLKQAVLETAGEERTYAATRFTANDAAAIRYLTDASLLLTDCRFVKNDAFALIETENAKAVLSMKSGATDPSQMLLARVAGGSLNITAEATQLYGNIESDETAKLSLTLKGGSAYTGAFHAEYPTGISISLSADSSWTVTENTTIGILLAEDTTFSNIYSEGHTVYYDSSLAENAWLAEKSYVLSGNGFLVPLI